MRVLKGDGTFCSCTTWQNVKFAFSVTDSAIGVLHSPLLPAALWPCDRPKH